MFNFDPYTILFTALNLLVLYFLLKHFLFGPVTAIMDSRVKTIEASLLAAAETQAEAERRRTEYEHQIASARADAAGIISLAKGRGEREYRAVLERAEADAERLREETRNQLAADRAQLLRGARQEVAALALLAAAKVAGQAMDSAGDRALVNAFLSEAGEAQ